MEIARRAALPAAISTYWGKACPSSEEGARYHLLPFHCLDVAAVAAVWWSSSVNIRRQFGALVGNAVDETHLRAWVLFFVALHDLGKFDIRFQLKAAEAHAALQPAWPADELPGRDEVERYAHGEYGFRWFLREYPILLGIGERDEAVVDAWEPWLAAVAGHHGKVPRNREPARPLDAEEQIVEHDEIARHGWFLTLEALFLTPCGLSLRDRPPPLHLDSAAYLAGFCAVCDWVGSNEDWFRYRADASDDLAEYFDDRVAMIGRERLIARCGLAESPQPFAGVAALLGATESPRQLQTLVDDLPPNAGLTLVEAPTGSGKTEAALAYAWRLLDAGIADSIMFALPTQATANAMWERLNRFADTLFGEGCNLVLAHGKARWHEGHGSLKDAARQRSAQGGEDIRVQCAEWLAESRKRVFLGQIGVCTIDQVLLSVLPLRHKFVRGFGVMKSVLIVDEVHAYDHYMYGLLDGVLRQQRRAGGSAILLSATLPHGQRRRLVEAWGAVEPFPENSPYPLLTRIDATGKPSLVQTDPLHRPPERSVTIDCRSAAGLFPDDALIDELIAAAESGARIAVVCNLVNDAQRLARRLRAVTEIPIDLFHARYRFVDRQHREEDVLAWYGRSAARNSGRILVATQVVEQSLDLDFDWLITQLCPVDLLFQRMGRLHRHERQRPPGFERPRCTVLVAADADYGLHKVIYGNTRILWRTQQMLATAEVAFPNAYRTWIERVYAREDWHDEPEHIALDYERFRVCENGKFREAQGMANPDMNPFDDSEENVLALTRDGEMSLSVALIDTAGRLLGDLEPIAEVDEWERRERIALATVSVPATWKRHLPAAEKGEPIWLVMRQDEAGDWRGQGIGTAFRYSLDYGLEKEGA